MSWSSSWIPTDGGYDIVIESVGGSTLAAAMTRLEQWGIVVNFGISSGEPTTFDASAFYPQVGVRLYGFRVFEELDRNDSAVSDLTFLAGEVAAGRLDTQIDLTTSWRDAAGALEALIERRVRGKAVLTID